MRIIDSSGENVRGKIYEDKREYNPYFSDISDYYQDEDNVDNDYLTKYDLKYREGESESQRKKRLRLAREANKQKERQRSIRRGSGILELSFLRVLRILIVGILGSFFFFTCVLFLYTKYIRYPEMEKVVYEKTGRYALDNWSNALSNYGEGVTSYLMLDQNSVSYLENELVYANGNDLKKDFFSKMVSTVSYKPNKVTAKNVYGNDMVDSNNDEKILIDSYVTQGEEVNLSYVDYSKIYVDKGIVKSMMREQNLKLGDAGYNSKLTNLFCRYILNLGELPIKTVSHVPNLYGNEESGYRITEEEDVFLDKLLFSSQELYDLTMRFSEAAGEDSINPDWNTWNLSQNRSSENEPVKMYTKLPIQQSWLEWVNSSDKDNVLEPSKYRSDYVIGRTWCGSYYLQHEYAEIDSNGKKVYRVIEPSLGDGSFENPASLNTEVVTTVRNGYKGKDGKVVTEDCPIGITMIEFGVSQDALDWFDSKDERNRGHDIKSEVQYAYYRFRIRNLSNRTVVVTDNSSLCDDNVNFSERTGIIYGLTDKLTLKPGQEGILESWTASTDLPRKYLVWGRSFSRESDVVWFRKLAGDLENTDPNKGVMVNDTRLSNMNGEVSN